MSPMFQADFFDFERLLLRGETVFGLDFSKDFGCSLLTVWLPRGGKSSLRVDFIRMSSLTFKRCRICSY